MDRKDFFKSVCGFACIGTVLSIQSCAPTKIMNGNIVGDDCIIPLSDFETNTGTEKHFKKYIIITNQILQYPICVYRHSEQDYSALWMRCTHQGTELQVFGDTLQCPAHGSEFNNKGGVQTGPADNKLRSFPVIIENGRLKISLKAA
jgi:Rieske Fe-S protein